MYINEVENFLFKLYKEKNKEIRLLDIYFSQLFKNDNNIYSNISMLFAFLLSVSNRLGNICIPIFNLINKDLFNNKILNFLYYFFKKISIYKCIIILYKINILSSSFMNSCTPFIMYNNYIYMNKFFFYENNIVNFFKENLFIQYKFNKKKIKYMFDIFRNNKFDLYEKISILNVLLNKISIISGGPGTGKTTLIPNLIYILYKVYRFKFKYFIKVISFTGKSVSNLTNFLNKGYKNLKISENIINILPNKAFTIHKFLGINYKGDFIKNNNLNFTKILIIDEFSMIDLITLNYIFLLFKKNNFLKIIFLGDSNQINPINSCSFLNEICNYKYSIFNKKKYIFNILYKFNFNFLKSKLNLNKLNNNISFLFKNYRFSKNKYLIKISNFINLGFLNEIDNFIYKNNFNYNFNFYDSKKFNFEFCINLCLKNYKDYINIIKSNFNYKDLLYFFNKFKIICLLKKNIFGTSYFNNYINKYILKYCYYNNIFFDYINKKFYYNGQPILVNKNNNDLNLFNGDSGFFIFINNELNILFIKSFNNYKTICFNNFKD